MKKFLKTLIDLKTDPTKLVVLGLGGGGIYPKTELLPRDFIRFSKEDIKDDTTRGLINSLTNSKRAIDCQIDNALQSFGINLENLKYSEHLR